MFDQKCLIPDTDYGILATIDCLARIVQILSVVLSKYVTAAARTAGRDTMKYLLGPPRITEHTIQFGLQLSLYNEYNASTIFDDRILIV